MTGKFQINENLNDNGFFKLEKDDLKNKRKFSAEKISDADTLENN